jgi:glutamate synthase domain-containing protein 2
MESVAYLRNLGFKGISLKTGSYDSETLAMAIRYSADANIDLLTIDGSGGGTGQSPWNMMEQWGVPSLNLHQLAYEQCRILESSGIKAPDLAFAGGLVREDHMFKALALGAPYAKLICMGRSMMIGGYLGNNIQGALDEDVKAEVHGRWDELPASVLKFGKTPKEILAGYEAVEKLVGKTDMKTLPLGTVCIYNYVDKLTCGLQQFLAGVRKFKVPEINRDDLMSANYETKTLTNIPLMGSNDPISHEILTK